MTWSIDQSEIDVITYLRDISLACGTGAIDNDLTSEASDLDCCIVMIGYWNRIASSVGAAQDNTTPSTVLEAIGIMTKLAGSVCKAVGQA